MNQAQIKSLRQWTVSVTFPFFPNNSNKTKTQRQRNYRLSVIKIHCLLALSSHCWPAFQSQVNPVSDIDDLPVWLSFYLSLFLMVVFLGCFVFFVFCCCCQSPFIHRVKQILVTLPPGLKVIKLDKNLSPLWGIQFLCCPRRRPGLNWNDRLVDWCLTPHRI